MAGWPWPLGGVQEFFENLWNWVSAAAVNAVSVVYGWISSIVSSLWSQIVTWFNMAVENIAGAVQAVWTSVSGALSGLWDQIVGYFNMAVESIGAGLSSLWNSISAAFSGALGTLSAWLTDLWETVSGAVGAVGTTLSLGITSITAWVSKGLGDLWTGFTEWGSNALGTVTTMFDGAVAGIGKWVSDALAGVAKALGEGLSSFIGWIQEKFNVLTGWLVGGIQALGGALQSVFEGIISMIFAPITQALTPGSPPEPLGEVTRNFGVALMDNIVAEAKKIHESPAQREKAVAAGAAVLGSIGLMHSVGGALTMAFDATHPVKTWGTADLFHRVALNLLSSPVTSAILATPVIIGIVTPMRQYFNAMFQSNIPSYGDMIGIYVREGYLPEYQEEIPEGMIEDFKLLGYSEYWTKALWGKHWVLPATGQVFEMMHRGIIDDVTMSTYLKTADILGVWRERLIAISWDLPGRIDARWMAGWDLIDVDEYGDILVKRGLDPEWRDRVAEATIKQQLAPEINKLRDNAKRDFVKGYILESVLRADLIALGYSAAKIDYHVADAVADRAREHKDDLLDFYKDGYRKDLITQEVFEDRVYEIIAEFEVASLFIEKAYVDKYKKPLPPRDVEAEKIERDLFKYRVTYIRQLYRTYTIEKPEMISMWVEAGMDPDVAATRADYEELKRPIVKPPPEEIARRKEQLRIQKLEEAKSKEEFRKEIRTAEELLTVLMDIGYSEALAYAITQLEIVRALPKPEAG